MESGNVVHMVEEIIVKQNPTVSSLIRTLGHLPLGYFTYGQFFCSNTFEIQQVLEYRESDYRDPCNTHRGRLKYFFTIKIK